MEGLWKGSWKILYTKAGRRGAQVVPLVAPLCRLNRRRQTLHSQKEKAYFTTRAGGRKIFLLAWQQPSQRETVANQPTKGHYASNSQFTPIAFLFITTVPPNFPFFSIKKHSFPLFCGPASGFCYRLLVPDCNSSAIPE